jgi:predicted acetyltransferase
MSEDLRLVEPSVEYQDDFQAMAREMGLKRVLITCDADNVASARIIEKNGGRLENQSVSRETGRLKNRYWIEL